MAFPFTILIFISSCNSPKRLALPARTATAETGSEFYKSVFTVDRTQREDMATNEILQGNVPPFLRKFVKIKTSITTAEGEKITAVYFVLPDYLSIGSGKDFARIPLTPVTAQLIADSLHCFLPTRKMVNDIYKAASNHVLEMSIPIKFFNLLIQ